MRDDRPIFVGTTPVGFVMSSENHDVERSAYAGLSTSINAEAVTGAFTSANAEGRPNSCNLNLIGNQVVPGPPLPTPSPFGSVQPNLTNPLTNLNPLKIGND